MTANQARVLGALIEKSVTTPEYYPLSLNALTNACNQKSSRDPVTNFSESVVQSLCQNLQEKHFVVKEANSRSIKYKHRFFNTEFGELKLSDDQVAVICVMLLRGNQSAGELKTRCQRLYEFQDNQEVEQTLHSLVEHPKGPFVTELSKESGKRDTRWAHLFVQNLGGEVESSQDHSGTFEEKVSTKEDVTADPVRLEPNTQIDIIAEINALKREVAALKLQIHNIENKNI